MRKLIFCIPLLLILCLESQELSEAFASSLPEDIKKDILDRAGKDPEDEKETYRSSRFSSKVQKEEELVELKMRIEEDLQELERRLSSDKDLSYASDELELFGKDFFDSIQTTFMPINEPNLDSSYTLDSGDLLEIQIIGQVDTIDSYLISRDGSINIPDIGKLNLSGMKLEDATEYIKSKIENAYIGTEAFISLKNVRDVNILVSGNAFNPGVYTISGNSNILHAVNVAGGINEYGSYREIKLIRNNEVIEVLDIYEVLITGIFNLNKRLRSGDVVFVEPINNIVAINGAVKRPAKYELLDGQTLDHVINYANGITNSADLKNIFLDRILDGNLESLPIVSPNQFSSIKAMDGDTVYIREYSYRTVTVSGAVYKPGQYLMSNGDTIKDVIGKAGGYLDNAYPFGAVYENNIALEINKMAKEVLYEEFLDNIISLSQQNPSGNFDFSSIIGLTQDIKNAKPNGRVSIDLFSDSQESKIFVKDGDKILIPEKPNHVYIYGEVSSEGAIPFVEQSDVDYYVSKSGGYKRYADKKSIYILHPNGDTQKFSKDRNIFANQPYEIKLYPGSVIFIPRELDDSAARRLSAQAYVSILGNIGVALASLSAIDNN